MNNPLTPGASLSVYSRMVIAGLPITCPSPRQSVCSRQLTCRRSIPYVPLQVDAVNLAPVWFVPEQNGICLRQLCLDLAGIDVADLFGDHRAEARQGIGGRGERINARPQCSHARSTAMTRAVCGG